MNFAILSAILQMKDTLTPQLQKTAKDIGPIAAKIGTAVAAGVAAAAAAFVAAAKAALDFADALDNQQKATQAGVESLQLLNVAAQRVGAGPEAITAAFRKMNDVLGSGTKETVRTLDSIGLSFEKIRSLKPEDQFRTIMDALSKIPDVNQRVALGTDLIGKGYAQLQTVAGTALTALEERMRSLGLIIDQETIAAVDALGDDLELLQSTMSATVTQFGSAIASSGELRDAVGRATDAVGLMNRFIADNRTEITQWIDGVVKPAAGAVDDLVIALGTWALALMRLNELNLKAERLMTMLGQGVRPLSEINAELAEAQAFADKFHQSLTELDQVLNPSELLGSVQSYGRSLSETKTETRDMTGATELSAKALKEQAEAAKLAAKEHARLLAVMHREMLKIATSTKIPPIFTENYLGVTEGIVEALEEIPPTLGDIDAGIASAFGPDGQVLVGGLVEKTHTWKGSMDTVNDALSEARGLFTLLGVESDSVFGKLLDWVSKAFDAFNSLTGMISKIAGLFGSGTGSTVASLAGRALGIGSSAATTAAVGAATAGTAAAVGGAAIPVAGSFTGAGLSATVGGGAAAAGMSGGMIALAATGYGAIAVAAIVAIRAALKKASAETTAEFLGIDFEVLSEGLRKELQTMGKETGDFATALQLNLGQVFAEGGVSNINAQVEKVADSFSFLERKQITAAETQQILNDTVGQLLPVVNQMGEQGVFQLERLFSAAAATGTQFEGMDQLAAAYVQRAKELGIAVNDVALSTLGLQSAIQGAFAPETMEGIAAKFKLTNDQVRELGALVGKPIQTELERMAASVSLSVPAFEALGAAVKEKYGLELEQIGPLLASMGVDAATFAKALGVEVASGAGGLNEELGGANTQLLDAGAYSRALAENLERAAAASINIHIPAFPSGSGSPVPPDFPVTGAANEFQGRVRGPRGFLIESGVIEDVSITRPGSGKGGGGTVQVTIDARGAFFPDSSSMDRFSDLMAEKFANRLHNNPGGLRTAIKKLQEE